MRKQVGQKDVVHCCKFTRKLLTTCCVTSDHKAGDAKLINSEGTGVGERVTENCENDDDADL